MGFAEEMLNLGEKLVNSADSRINGNRNRIKNIKGMIHKFHLGNKQMARDLRNNLNEFTENLNGEVNRLRRKFKKEHKEMRKTQHETFEEFKENLSENVNHILKGARGFIKKCHKNSMGTHNECIMAHKNFMTCMKEIERKKRHSHNFGKFEPSSNTPKKRGRKRTMH